MSEKNSELFDLNKFLAESVANSSPEEDIAEKVVDEDGVEEDQLFSPDAPEAQDVANGDEEHSEDDMSPELEEFCLQCMRMYANVHLWHLQTGSYAEHEALEAYYESLFELTDSFIEAAVANSGALSCDTSFNLELLPYGEMIEEVEAFKEHVSAQKEQLSEEGMINILDDVLSETDEVLYKLKNLS